MATLATVHLDLARKCVDVTTVEGAKASFKVGKRGAAASLREAASKERTLAAEMVANAELMEAAADAL